MGQTTKFRMFAKHFLFIVSESSLTTVIRKRLKQISLRDSLRLLGHLENMMEKGVPNNRTIYV